MKKSTIKLSGVLFALVIGLCWAPTAYAAEDTFVINALSESFMPTQGNDAALSLSMDAVADQEGMVYIPQNTASYELLSVTIDGRTVSGEFVQRGAVPYVAVAAGKPGEEVRLQAEIACKDFYKGKAANPVTGIPSTTLTYKYTNKLEQNVGPYQLKITLPEGKEPISVKTPSDVTTYQMGLENGLRTLSLSQKSVAASATVTFDFNFGVPFSSKLLVMIILWVLILAVSAYVLFRKLQKPE